MTNIESIATSYAALKFRATIYSLCSIIFVIYYLNTLRIVMLRRNIFSIRVEIVMSFEP